MTFTSPALERLRAARRHAEPPPSAAPQPPAQTAPEPAPLAARPASPPVPSSPPPVTLPLPSPRPRLDLGGMPPHLAQMVAAAQRGELPRGVHLLESGLVMDLGGYVLAWAECWPRDRVHLTRRLGEAYAVLRQA